MKRVTINIILMYLLGVFLVDLMNNFQKLDLKSQKFPRVRINEGKKSVTDSEKAKKKKKSK